MKPLAIWLAIVAVVFGGYALITVGTRDTTMVYVFVDSSNPMQPVWRKVGQELDRIDDRDHAEFALAEGQRQRSRLVHSYGPILRLDNVTPFAPCSFADVEAFAEAADADEKILITTAASTTSPACDTTTLSGWKIIELAP